MTTSKGPSAFRRWLGGPASSGLGRPSATSFTKPTCSPRSPALEVPRANIPTDRIIDGVDQTALFLKGDTYSRRDYNFIYMGDILAATVKGRYKRVWVGEEPGLSGAAFFDLYTDPREVSPKMLPLFPAKEMFNIMKVRHGVWMGSTPNKSDTRLSSDRHRERPPRNQGRGPATR